MVGLCADGGQRIFGVLLPSRFGQVIEAVVARGLIVREGTSRSRA